MKKLLISCAFLGLFLNTNVYYAQTETSGRTGVYRATHTKTTELKHTKLKVSFDFQKEHMHGEAWITASPYFYSTDQLVLDAKAMLIHEVRLDQNGKKSPLNYEYKDDQIKITLDKTYTKNQDYQVYIKYTARPNEVKQEGSAAINDAKGLYFINPRGEEIDKPTQIWTQGETESSSCWFPTIDKPNQKTTQEIYMTVPDKFITLSNGLLKSSTKEANGQRTDHWVMDKKHAPYLFFMGVGEYSVVKDKWKNIAVDYYVEKEYEAYAKQIFGMTPEMIEFFSKVLHYEYPWQKYAQIVGRDYVSGAMENTTAVLHAEQAQQKPGDLIDENTWENTIAHELFHHWFGDLVTTESWSQLTMNESLANYSEYLWNEYKHGKDAADHHLMTDIEYYKHTAADFNKDLVRFDYASREDVFDLVSYNKGGSILHMLRNYVGDEAFFLALNDYLKTNEYGTGEAHQLRLSLEKITGKDMNWFFNQWYFGSGHPKLDIKYSYEPVKKEVVVSVSQAQSGAFFEFPLAIDVYEGTKVKRHNVWVSAKTKNDFVIGYTQKPDLIHVNADEILLAEINDSKTPEQYFHQYTNAKEFKSRYLAVENAKENLDKNSSALKTIVAALKDPFFRIRIEALSALDLSNSNQAKQALAQVEKMASSDGKTLVRGAALAALAKTNNKKYLPMFEKGLSEVSNSIKANSLAGISVVAPEKVSAYADKIDLSSAPEDLIIKLLPTIVENKITSQMPYIAKVVAFYPFTAYSNPEIAKPAEDGYNWIMESDNLKATQNVTKILMQVKSQVANNPQAKMIIVDVLKKGLDKKMAQLRANPQSKSLDEQVKLINKAIESYK